MEVEEVEAAIDELETRLERLRSLYEQYFLGIEKIEPTVARKDVDRRIWLLRREQIRNTARRFKLQTIIQRYNTFQQYWQRICREIENGTYKRHLLRAEKNFGPDQALTIVARKRFRNRQKAETAAADKAQDAQKQLAAELGAALDDKNYDPLEEAKRAVDAALGRSDAGGPQAAAEPPHNEPTAPPPPGTPARSASARPKQDSGRLELDLDDDLLGGQQAPKPVRPAAAVQARAPDRVASPTAPARPAGPAPTRPAQAGRPPPPGRPAPAPSARPAPPQASKSAAGPAPKPASPAPSGAKGRPPPPPRAAPAAPARAAPPPARPRAAATPRQAGMSEDQVRKLHARLVDARKKTNDHRNISVDGLKKSLEAAESKLRKRHGNRNIDFDVVIKDGKAVVKPIVR